MKVYLNGQFVDSAEATVSVFDHGLLYGDGIFEGIRLYKGCVFKLDEHLDRLEKSAKAILLRMPWSREQLAEAVCESCRVNNLEDGYIRLVVTRGVGSLGLSHLSCKDPQLIIIADKITLYPEEHYTQGLKIITSPTRRINPAALAPMVKSLNYLNNILAKADANQAGCLEAIMLNDQGYVAECTGDNIFIRHKDKWFTPPTAAGALKGITRGAVLEIMEKLGYSCEEMNLTRYDIWTADEMFLTGTAAEVIPVVEVDSRTIGEGIPGKQTHQLLEAFHDLVSKDGVMIR
ncbi:branched-chain-amino-acid transaminase [Puniceicoccales bacterium CK1056]|uniref:Branched-chain-amino-acid aminotransferase n=1 Tax=Oceanipulchritudo coccoides TaxID=2706888 RepID=A0A6B2LYF7_9BACT|nr:branched-chain-amino-acid transaminase [Oceanipulchritudo coccoides]NDV61172.1 branched-chain-amino-acid transaminase [Oceanipulchritudo coccoides]